MRRLCILATAVFVIALAAPVSPASAAFTLNLSAPGPAVVGQPLILQANGTLDVDELEFLFWFSMVWIPTDVTTTCPNDHFVGTQFATQNGGGIIVFTQRANPQDAAGNFSIPVAITPSEAGTVLLCAYTDDGLTKTMATASLLLDIAPAGSQQPKPEPGDTPRWNTRTIRADAIAGIRGCRALLRRPAACERKIIRLAGSRCRKLRPERARTNCLRVVRRVARRY